MFQTQRAILPIVRLNDEDEIVALLGTGFVILPGLQIITARHVFDNIDPAEFNTVAVALKEQQLISPHIHALTIRRVQSAFLSQEHDVAVCQLADATGLVGLGIAENQLPPNEDVLTCEYSGTEFVGDPSGARDVLFSPITHKGNILRHYVSTWPEARPTPVCETPFPALQGASGAPLVFLRNQLVVGMLVANVEHHLLPAQVIRIEQGETLTEEVKYFLPHGKAIEGAVLISAIRGLGVEVTTGQV